jgi:hypothetical protein
MFNFLNNSKTQSQPVSKEINDAISHISHHTDLQSQLSPPFLTSFEDALVEIEYRRKHTNLKERVDAFLNNDIPTVFKSEEPIFYLSRHIATPNYETLRFIELTINHSYATVVGQDPNDVFVSNNCLKRALGKMQIMKGSTRNGDEIVENFTILDFNQCQGRQLQNCTTTTGTNLVKFHNDLLREIYPNDVVLSVESEWIDRNNRGNLYEHYVKYLSLLIVHGISFEDYVQEDIPFVSSSLVPAIETVTKLFGCKPLICPLIPPDLAFEKNWVGYPSVIYPFVKREIKTH